MATTGNERYLRYIFLLGRGGPLVLKGIINREVQKQGKTLSQILSDNNGRLRQLIRNDSQYDRLFPSASPVNSDLDKWDISLLCLVLLNIFGGNLTSKERNDIKNIRTFRNEIQGHFASLSLEESEYNSCRSDLILVLLSLSNGLNRQIHNNCQDLIKTAASGSLEIRSTLEDFKEFQEELLTQIKSDFGATHIKLDAICNEIQRIQGLVVSAQPRELPEADRQRLCNLEEGQYELKQMVQQIQDMLKEKVASPNGDNLDNTYIEEDVETRMNVRSRTDENASAAEDTLVQKINELLNEINCAPVPKKVNEQQIRDRVQQFLRRKKVDLNQEELTIALMEMMIDIVKQSGTSILTAEKSCIRFRIRCTTYDGLLGLLEYLGSKDFEQRLHSIASALTAQSGISFFLTTEISTHSLQQIWSHLTRKRDNAGTLMTRKRTVKLPIRCTNIGGLEHVWKLFQEGAAKPHLKRISDILSNIVGGKVLLTTSVELKKFKQSLHDIESVSKSSNNLKDQHMFITEPLQGRSAVIHRMDDSTALSVTLSDILEDIGVNEENVAKRRGASLMQESIHNAAETLLGINNSAYYVLGSQTEGTTTPGLNSEFNRFLCLNDVNVIQELEEWKPRVYNYKVIKQETIPPGYCRLVYITTDIQLEISENSYVEERLLRNDFTGTLSKWAYGPAAPLAYKQNDSFNVCLPCHGQSNESKLLLATSESSGWPTKDMKRYLTEIGCFVVPFPSTKTDSPDLEWKIYYGLAERCFMFNLNITQIRCLILMKIILKASMYPLSSIPHSSVICKAVLFYCIAHTNYNVWHRNNLWCCLTDCFKVLYQFVLYGNCPHFFDHEDNLIGNEISLADKGVVLKTLRTIIHDGFHTLLSIEIDDLGQRLRKEIIFKESIHGVSPANFSDTDKSELQSLPMIKYVSACHTYILARVGNMNSLQEILLVLERSLLHLTILHQTQNNLWKRAYALLGPFICTTFGSIKASQMLLENKPVGGALTFVALGLNSDVASGRLKLASVLYCAGDMENTKYILEEVETLFDACTTEQVCSCKLETSFQKWFDLKTHWESQNVKYNAAFCVKFLRCEEKCIPKEMQYELFRLNQDTIFLAEPVHFIAVDALPYMYFLQFKTYQRLGNFKNQNRALDNLIVATEKEHLLGHRETTLNLLGQCMEDVGRQDDALKYYKSALDKCGQSNIANVHICKLLARYFIFFWTLISYVRSAHGRIGTRFLSNPQRDKLDENKEMENSSQLCVPYVKHM